LVPVLLTFGAINALVPILIIIILIAAAAALNRGWNVLNVFGIGVLAGVAGQAGVRGSMRGKTSFTGGKRPGRGYKEVWKGAKGATMAQNRNTIKKNLPSQTQAKTSLVNSTVNYLSGKGPTPAPSMSKIKMAVVGLTAGLTWDKDLTKYRKTIKKLEQTTNTLSNPNLSPSDRSKAIISKSEATVSKMLLENAIVKSVGGSGAKRPITNVEEVQEAVKPPHKTNPLRKPENEPQYVAERRVETLKAQGYAVGPLTVAGIGKEAREKAEWTERQTQFMNAVNDIKSDPARLAAFRAKIPTAQQAEVSGLADSYLYNATPHPNVETELKKIPAAVTNAYNAAPKYSETGLRKFATELGFPSTATREGRQAFVGYAVGSVATLGVIPLANVISRRVTKWHLSK